MVTSEAVYKADTEAAECIPGSTDGAEAEQVSRGTYTRVTVGADDRY